MFFLEIILVVSIKIYTFAYGKQQCGAICKKIDDDKID